MQSLSFKVFMDLNAVVTARSCLPRVADREVGEREKGLNCRDHRRCRIVACASGAESQSASSSSKYFLSRSQSYALLKQQMEVAARSEDAARYRDELKEIAAARSPEMFK